jgi:outer membrane protein OmpA-like peptidoglycan-associated protein
MFRAHLQRRHAAIAALLSATIVAQRSGASEAVSLQLPKAPAGDRAWLTSGADARGEGTLRARVAVDYATDPLVVLDPMQVAHRVVKQQLWLEPSVSFALAQRVLVFAELPLLVSASGAAPLDRSLGLGTVDNGAGLGDPRLGARARLFGEPDSDAKLAAGVEGWLPFGSADFGRDRTLRARPFFVGTFTPARARSGLELGVLFRSQTKIPGILPLRSGPALTAAVSAALALDASGKLEVGPELAVALGMGAATRLFDPRSTVGQALLGLRWSVPVVPLVLALGAGSGVGQGPGAADLRVLASVTWSPEAPPPPRDSDADRVPDDRDACPRTRGVTSGDPMMDGCPELPTDTDGDAIPDLRDACPKRPGPGHADPRLHGCPPSTPVPPPEPRATLVESRIVISEQVKFETDTAVVRAESGALLGEVVRELQEHPELKLVEVAGHTDATGAAEHNLRLSGERAAAVMAWLVAHGVAPSRLIARGYGSEQPLADNTTGEGRAQNRRVEFRVLDPQPEAKP